jgi:hypothetical protein
MAVATWAGIKNFYVPKLGLADGIIYNLWQQYQQKNGI